MTASELLFYQLVQRSKPDLAAEGNCTSKSDFVHNVPAAPSFAQTFMGKAPADDLAHEVTGDLAQRKKKNFNKIAPSGKEDTATELQDHTAKTQDILVDTVENAEVAEIKRATFRALTMLRAATIKVWKAGENVHPGRALWQASCSVH